MIVEAAEALPAMDRGARLERTRAALADAGCDALVVTKLVNIEWLTGFTGSNATAVVTADNLGLITDGRYESQATEQLQAARVEAEITIERDIREPVLAAVAAAERIGLESHDVTWDAKRRFAEWFEGRSLVPTTELIEDQRRYKDGGEIARLKRAAAIADAALDQARTALAGRSERAVARLIDSTMLDLGADDISFPTIVASGPNSAKPHARPSGRVLGPGDLVVIDFGAKVDGYGSDMTRTFIIGQSTERQRELFDAVVEAQAAGVAAVRAGVEEREIDRVCREALERRGLGDAFVHGTGHGIGLEIHENPFLSAKASGILRSGYVVTVEPGAYLPDLGGVRIEDSVVVTESGCEPITLSSKSPIPEPA